MPYVFDEVDKVITLPEAVGGVATIDVEEIYDEAKQWYGYVQNRRLTDFPFRTSGGEELTPGIKAGAYYQLQNQRGAGWRIRPFEGDANYYFIGNLTPADATQDILIPTIGAYTVGIFGLQPITQNVSQILEQQQLAQFTDARVWIDVDGGEAGTADPIGTPGRPSSNLADSQTIISVRGLPKRLHLRGTLPVGATDVLDEYDIEGNGDLLSGMVFTAGASITKARFSGLYINGTVSGVSQYVGCRLDDVTGFEGQASACRLDNKIILAGSASFNGCDSDVAGASIPEIDCNSLPGIDVQVRDYYGGLLLTNFDQPFNNASFDSASIRLTLADTCSAGVAVVGGSGKLTNLATGTFVRDESFNNVSDDESIKIGEIHRRLDLVGNQVYANDGSFITNPEFTLRKVDNGDGTFTMVRVGGEAAANTTHLWRGSVEPASVNPSGNEVRTWRGAIEPQAL